mmetsp:Transcript_51408/g.129762  ORF Transcript_51408/g.129762 Transcript_51408/m.129762 type:complete len:550 (-) Transcript_51408:69-1718(-)
MAASATTTPGLAGGLPEIRPLRTGTGDPQIQALFSVRCSRTKAESAKVSAELFCKVFEQYTHVLSENGRPIHILAQREVAASQVKHVQNVVASMLTESGCEDCVPKAAIGNAAADLGLIIAVLDEKRMKSRDARELRRTDILDQVLFVKEVIVPGSDPHQRGKKDATWEEVLHNIQNFGIRAAAPTFQLELDDALEDALLAGSYIPDQEYDSWTLVSQEFFAVTMETYFGMSETRGDGLSGGEYIYIRRADMEVADPKTCGLIRRFFKPDSGLPIAPNVRRPNLAHPARGSNDAGGGIHDHLPREGREKLERRESARRWWAAVALLRCERPGPTGIEATKALLGRACDLLCDPAFKPQRAAKNRTIALRAAAARAALRQICAKGQNLQDEQAVPMLACIRREMGLRVRRLPREDELEGKVKAFLLDLNRLRARELQGERSPAFDDLFKLFMEGGSEEGTQKLCESDLCDLLLAVGFDEFDEAAELARSLCASANGGSLDKAFFSTAITQWARADHSRGGRERGGGRSSSGSSSGSGRSSSSGSGSGSSR